MKENVDSHVAALAVASCPDMCAAGADIQFHVASVGGARLACKPPSQTRLNQ